MVSIAQVKQGLAQFVDSEIAAKLPGWKRWAVTAAAAAYIENLDSILHRLNESEAFKLMGLTDADGIDIEKLYQYIRPAAEKGNAPVNFPVIGTITFSAADVDKLYNLIMRG